MGFFTCGVGCYIDSRADIRSPERIAIGDRVLILTDCWLNVVEPEIGCQPKIVIGSGSQIGRRATISAVNLIHIGNDVLFGPNVTVLDHNHRYDQVGVPILAQGLDCRTNQVRIDDGCWLGANVVVAGNVHIGQGSVIGANSVVTSDVPAYCVAVGSPAKVVKAWDRRSGEWVRVRDEAELQAVLSARRSDTPAPVVAGGVEPSVHFVPFRQLRSVQIEVSSACNLRCPQCFNCIPSHRTAVMPYPFFQEKIEPHLKQFGAVHLVGIGEPLTNKEFFRFVSASVAAGCRVFTTSNLQLVTPEIADRLVESGVDELSFSCDGIRPETYESIRRGGTWARFESGLAAVVAAKERRGSQSPRLTLNFGALRRNIEELPDVISFAADHGVSQVIAYHVVHYTPDLANESLFHHQGLSDRYFLEAQARARELGVQLFLPGLFLDPLRWEPSPGRPFCSYPFEHLYVYSDGRVGPCCMDFPDRILLGDLNTQSLEELWNAPAIQSLRGSLEKHQPCRTCRFCVSHGRMDISDPRFLFQFEGADEYLLSKYGVA